MSISGSTISATFTYDPNGNETSGLGRATTWTSYNKPASITQGARTISFQDDPEQQRFRQVTPEGTTLYFQEFGVRAELLIGASTSQWTEYLTVGNQMVGVRFLAPATSSLTVRYFQTDHLGSVSIITDHLGVVVQRIAYDAWGKRRHPNGADDVAGVIESETTRGFTGHEELSIGSLVHMNGRLYDALLARMLSADPVVPDPLNLQSWNRYSYVDNSPLTFTDPSGHSKLSRFFRSVGQFFKKILANPIVRAIAQIVVAAVLTAVGAAAVVAAALSSATVTGLAGGRLGDVLKAAAIAGVTAFAFNAVGDFTGHTPAFAAPNHAANIAGHAGVGCLSAVASGGKCGPGALSGAAGSFASPLLRTHFQNPETNPADLFGGTAAHAAVGGQAWGGDLARRAYATSGA